MRKRNGIPKGNHDLTMYHRLRDHAKHLIRQRKVYWELMVAVLIRRRRRRRHFNDNALLLLAAKTFMYRKEEMRLACARVREIKTESWRGVVYGMADDQFLAMFRITKTEFPAVVSACAWPAHLTSTKRNQYATCPELSTLILLRRLCSPCRWTDLVDVFKNHPSHLSEIFWESLSRFIHKREHLVNGDLHAGFSARNAAKYAQSIHSKCEVLDHCIGFLDGTVIGIARPGSNIEQNAAYNGHKRKHALKFQTMTTPDGLILHAFGPLEGCRHDWALFVRSNIETQLENVCFVNGVQFYVHADSGYNRRTVIDVPFQGAHLTRAQKKANTATASVRVTVEWAYKEVKLYWTTVDFKRKLRVGEVAVGMMYMGAILLHNIRNCLYPNTISQYFQCHPPALVDYIHHKDV